VIDVEGSLRFSDNCEYLFLDCIVPHINTTFLTIENKIYQELSGICTEKRINMEGTQMPSSPVSLTPLGRLLIGLCAMPVPRWKSDLNKLKISAAILILKNVLELPPTMPHVSQVTGISKQRISEIEPSELLSASYHIDKLSLKPLLDSEGLMKVELRTGKFAFESQPRRKYGASKARGSKGKYFSIKKSEQMQAYEKLRSKESEKIEDALKRIENPAAAWLIRGVIMSSQIFYLRVLTHPSTIEHLREWCKLLEPIGRKALELAKEASVKVPEEYVLFYKFGWLKISIAFLACMQSDVDMDMCLKKFSRDPHVQDIMDEYNSVRI